MTECFLVQQIIGRAIEVNEGGGGVKDWVRGVFIIVQLKGRGIEGRLGILIQF